MSTAMDVHTVDQAGGVRVFREPAVPNSVALKAMGLRAMTSDELLSFLTYGSISMPAAYFLTPPGMVASA